MIIIYKLILYSQEIANYDQCMLLVIKYDMHYFIFDQLNSSFQNYNKKIKLKQINEDVKADEKGD